MLLWGLTAVFGTAQVERAVLDGLPQGSRPASGELQAIATSPAPLLVRVHYGSRTFDALEWHVWVMGVHGRVRTVRDRIF